MINILLTYHSLNFSIEIDFPSKSEKNPFSICGFFFPNVKQEKDNQWLSKPQQLQITNIISFPFHYIEIVFFFSLARQSFLSYRMRTIRRCFLFNNLPVIYGKWKPEIGVRAMDIMNICAPLNYNYTHFAIMQKRGSHCMQTTLSLQSTLSKEKNDDNFFQYLIVFPKKKKKNNFHCGFVCFCAGRMYFNTPVMIFLSSRKMRVAVIRNIREGTRWNVPTLYFWS